MDGHRHRGRTKRHIRDLVALLKSEIWICALVALIVAPSLSLAQPPVVSVTSCGIIGKSGVYEVDSLLTSSGGDCLIIRAPNVTLNLNSSVITGQQSGAGI